MAPNLAPPPGNPRFPLFDSLRAIAALSVFVGHTVTGTYTYARHPILFLAAAQLASQGVAIFFLISGFLLYRPFLTSRRSGRPYSLRAFARRRVLRIVPAYWLALTLFVALGLVHGVTAQNWWVFYGFGQIYSLRTSGRGLGVAWTLCTEVTFYAALPMLAFAASSLGRRAQSVRGDIVLLVGLSIGSLVFRAHSHGFLDVTVLTLPGMFVWFALGMGLAVASVRLRGIPIVERRPGVCWLLAAVAYLLLYYLIHAPNIPGLLVGHVLYGLVALFILLPAVFGDTAGGLPRRILRYRGLAWIGLVSYAFYLYHAIVIQEVNRLLTHEYVAVIVVSVLVTALCSAVSYYVVERPIMRFGGWQRIVHLFRSTRVVHGAEDLVLGDHGLPGCDSHSDAQSGEALGDREGARLQ